MSSRYVLIDMAHMGHMFQHASGSMSTTLEINGVPMPVDTTIPNGVLKSIYAKGGYGSHFVGVFLEGGAGPRKEHFAVQRNAATTAKSKVKDPSTVGYKGSRPKQRGGALYDGLNLTVSLLQEGGAQLYRKKDREADDMIASTILAIKAVDTTTPIDVYTNDSDLLPFVDDQVSVWIRCKALTYADEGLKRSTGYYQVTPDSWADYVTRPSHLKDYNLPYNSILLKKLIKGDDSDDIIGAVDKFGPKKYNEMIGKMLEDGVDFPTVFRYDVDFDEVIRPIMLKYFPSDQVDYMQFIFDGIKPILDDTVLPRRLDVGHMSRAALKIRVNLPVGR